MMWWPIGKRVSAWRDKGRRRKDATGGPSARRVSAWQDKDATRATSCEDHMIRALGSGLSAPGS